MVLLPPTLLQDANQPPLPQRPAGFSEAAHRPRSGPPRRRRTATAPSAPSTPSTTAPAPPARSPPTPTEAPSSRTPSAPAPTRRFRPQSTTGADRLTASPPPQQPPPQSLPPQRPAAAARRRSGPPSRRLPVVGRFPPSRTAVASASDPVVPVAARSRRRIPFPYRSHADAGSRADRLLPVVSERGQLLPHAAEVRHQRRAQAGPPPPSVGGLADGGRAGGVPADLRLGGVRLVRKPPEDIAPEPNRDEQTPAQPVPSVEETWRTAADAGWRAAGRR